VVELKDFVSTEEIIKAIKGIAEEIELKTDYLTSLDQAIGDGDHGISLRSGFRLVSDRIEELRGQDAGKILKTVGNLLISTVGGAVGPLYGIAFIRAGSVVDGKTEINMIDLVKMFESAEQGIVEIGKATVGEKTVLDAIHPAVLAIKKASEEKKSIVEALTMSVSAAKEGAESTIDMIAKRGRSSYLGDRSKGHQDVGATSSYLILKAGLETLVRIRKEQNCR
jgi:dihydroxyacetone kinase-like protein